MKRLIILLCFVISPVSAHEVFTAHCLWGCPSGAPDTNDLIVREIYTLSSNDRTKYADWVAYKITAETMGPSRSRNWKADPLLDPSETLEKEDYTGANAALGTDRGHQVPLASFSGTDHWRETNYLSNITPQDSDLNQGPWKHLEVAVRNLIQEEGFEAVYVQSGPLYERPRDPLPGADEPHTNPSGYWKIVTGVLEGEETTSAFIMDQDVTRSDSYCGMLVSVDTIESRSGLDMFSAMDDAEEAALELSIGGLGLAIGC